MRLGTAVRSALVVLCLAPGLLAASLAARRTLDPSSAYEPCAAAGPRVHAVGGARASSSVVLVRVASRQVAFVADPDGDEVLAFDVADAGLVARHSVLGAPSQLLFDEGRLYVASRESSVVQVFDVDADSVYCERGPLRRHANARGETKSRPMLRPVAKLRTSTEPVAMAMTADRATLLVLSGWGHTLEGFARTTQARSFAVDLPREPRALALDAKGKRAFVSHATGARASVVDLDGTSHAVRTLPLQGREGELSELAMPVQQMAMQLGLLGTEDGDVPRASRKREVGPRLGTQGFSIVALTVGGLERVLVPEVLVQPGKLPDPDPRTQRLAERPTGYGTFGAGFSFELAGFGAATGHIAAIDAETETVTQTSMVLTGEATRCLLPRAALADPARSTILVACLGTDEVDEWDARTTNPGEVLVARWKVSSGPTGIALDMDERLVVWSAFERVLAVVDRDIPGQTVFGSPTREREATPFEVGRKIFHAAGNHRVSSDGRACASCHPDGRDDGLTWISPDGPRQTPTLAGRLAITAPFGWTGAASTVRDHLQQTVKRLGGSGLTDKETYALLTYLSRMKAPPPAATARDAAKVARGETIFRSNEAGCSGCHVTNGDHVIGDGEVHDVGSVAKGDISPLLSTPSLQQVGGTAPYFHDGRYATLGELLRGTDGNMGNTGHLGDADLEALTTYLETL